MARSATPSLALLSLLVGCSGKADLSLTELTCDIDGVNTDPFAVSDARASLTADHESTDDYVYDEATATIVTLDGTTVTVDGEGATAEDGVLTITSPGTFVLSGVLSEGQIVVDAGDEGLVQVVLDGVSITSSSDAAIRVDQADRAVLILAEGSTNQVHDGESYPTDAEQDAAIWSDDDLSIGGRGTLVVEAHFEDGIASKDGLVIRDADITVSAPDEGLRGKDYLVVRGGVLDVFAGGDGLRSDEDGEDGLGYVLVEDGVISVDAAGDAVSAETDALVSGGTLSLTSGGGASVLPDGEASSKGLKAGRLLVVDAGELDIDASDDGVHADGNVVINGGVVRIATGDDAVHAELGLTINGGEVRVTESYEGIEVVAGDLVVNGGTVDVVAVDDGFNLSGDGDDPNGVESAGDPYDMVFNGGRVSVTSGNDGIDSNGSIVMTGGCLAISGPAPGTRPEQGAIDYNGSFEISGGLLVAAGAAGRMAQAPSSSSSQPSVAITFSAEQEAGTFVALEDGVDALAFAPTKVFQSVVVSAPWLATGQDVSLYQGGDLTGSAFGGLAEGGTLIDAKLLDAVSVTSVVTEVML